MKLTPEQIHTFDEQGYVFFPNCFSEDEVAVLRSEADAILRTNRQEVWRESSCSAKASMSTSSRSTPRQRSKATSGNGTRTTAPGRAMTACRSRGR
jgi:hypothetical protein